MKKFTNINLSIEQYQLGLILGCVLCPTSSEDNNETAYYLDKKSDYIPKITNSILKNSSEVKRLEAVYGNELSECFRFITKVLECDSMTYVYFTKLEAALISLLNPMIKFETDAHIKHRFIECRVREDDLEKLEKRCITLCDVGSEILTQIIKTRLSDLCKDGDEEC